jgi:polyferredoxin
MPLLPEEATSMNEDRTKPALPDWVRRLSPRGVVRGAFFAYFVYACVQLFRFAAWARGEGPYVARPEAPAGILPVGHYTSFFAWVRGGGWDTLLPAGLVIIIGALAVSLLFKRGFCGWICPVGSLWEASGWLGRRLLGRNLRVPRWLDLIGRTVRYLIAAAFMAFLILVPLSEAVGVRRWSYMWVADLKTLGVMMQPIYLAVVALAMVVSMLFGSVWCRYLCPLGGLYGALGVVSPNTVVRDDELCIRCGKCTGACHAFVDVERAGSVHHSECDGCIDCVRVCPAPGALTSRFLGRFSFPWIVWPMLVVGVWFAIYLAALLTGNWHSTIPAEAFRQVINSGLLQQTTPGF